MPAPASVSPGADGGPPRVSVVIRCYDQARFLPEAVASVVAQGFTGWEIVIVDDGSPDDTRQVAAGLAARHGGRVRLVSGPNGGPPHAANRGVEVARAELVLLLDADDALHPTFLEKTVGALDRNPWAGIAFTDVVLWGSACGAWRMGPFTLDALCRRNRLCFSSPFRKQLWREVGGFRPEMTLGYEDWDFWIGCAERGVRAVHVRELLFFYRMHAGGGSTNSTAMRHHRQLVAQVVRNHPVAFGPAALSAAAELLRREPLPDRRRARGAA